MAKYYVVEERDNTAGCLIGLFIAIAVIAVIIYLSVYVLGILLAVILGISALVGTVLIIKNHLVALAASIQMHRYDQKPQGWIIPNFMYRWVKISFESFKEAWRLNFEGVSNSFRKMGGHRLLSFGKWFHFVVGISLAVFGTLASVVFLLLHFQLMLWVIGLFFLLFLALSAIFILIGLCVAIGYTAKNYIEKLRLSYYNAALPFSMYITKRSFAELLSIIGNYWFDNMTSAKARLAQSAAYPFLSFFKWFHLWNGIMIAVAGALLIALYGILHVLTISILFLVFIIPALFRRGY